MFKIFTALLALIACYVFYPGHSNLPVVAIANYGPHDSLDQSIEGLKEYLASRHLIENKNIKYEILDVGFDQSLIPKMLLGLKAKQPKVMVIMTTPVAQVAKNMINDIPLVFNVITDPDKAGLLNKPNPISGSSDMQDVTVVFDFIQSLKPGFNSIGMLYAPSESNDLSLLDQMVKEARSRKIKLISLPLEHSRDAQYKISQFKNKVDVIYTGPSGPVQSALPALSASANKMNIPIVNFEGRAVKDGLVVASIGVDYRSVGKNAGKIVYDILSGKKPLKASTIYPSKHHHIGLIHLKNAKKHRIYLPKINKNVSLI